MRTETITRTIYSAAELKEANQKGFERALDHYREMVYSDPHWESEHWKSLDGVLDAIGTEGPSISGLRVLSWLENHVLGPLRIGWKGAKRWKLSRYGSHYRAGLVEPCPFTGYWLDDALLNELGKLARDGYSPSAIRVKLQEFAKEAWQDELESMTTEEAFLDDADANGREFLENGDWI